jgi:hypothetical protein
MQQAQAVMRVQQVQHRVLRGRVGQRLALRGLAERMAAV